MGDGLFRKGYSTFLLIRIRVLNFVEIVFEFSLIDYGE